MRDDGICVKISSLALWLSERIAHVGSIGVEAAGGIHYRWQVDEKYMRNFREGRLRFVPLRFWHDRACCFMQLCQRQAPNPEDFSFSFLRVQAIGFPGFVVEVSEDRRMETCNQCTLPMRFGTKAVQMLQFLQSGESSSA